MEIIIFILLLIIVGLLHMHTSRCIPVVGVRYQHRRIPDLIITVTTVDYDKVFYTVDENEYSIRRNDFEHIFVEYLG